MSAPPSYDEVSDGGVATITATSMTVQPPVPNPQHGQLPYPSGSEKPVPYPPAPYPTTMPVGTNTAHVQHTVQTSHAHMNIPPGAKDIVITTPEGTTIIRQVQPMPNDNLQCAIVVTVCCCFLFGLIAVVKSQEARRLYMEGDTDGANKAASTSRACSKLGVVVCIVLVVGSILLRFVALSY
ncbi:uncharacterized protein [Diadema antillarum]